MNPTIEIAIAAVALAVIVFVPRVRRAVSRVIAVCIAVLAIAVAVGGTAVLVNNISLYDSPGSSARIRRFLTVDWAATSEKGSGSAECGHGSSGGEAAGAAPEAEGRSRSKERKRAKPERREAKVAPAATPSPSAPGEQEDYYPELVRRGYPGISRGKLFELAQQTVNGLGGWKIVGSDARALTLDCVYTTRVLRMEDDVRITVMPNSEIDLCSRSRIGEPGSNSILGLFPGDFGANIGHIKEFYEALEPRVDAVYKEQERKANAQQP